MSKNWGRRGVRQSSGVNILKEKNLRSIDTSLPGVNKKCVPDDCALVVASSVLLPSLPRGVLTISPGLPSQHKKNVVKAALINVVWHKNCDVDKIGRVRYANATVGFKNHTKLVWAIKDHLCHMLFCESSHKKTMNWAVLFYWFWRKQVLTSGADENARDVVQGKSSFLLLLVKRESNLSPAGIFLKGP